MKLHTILESRAGFTKGTPLSDEIPDKFVYIFRAQPAHFTSITEGSYVTRSKKFAKEHAVSMANTEEEPYVVVMGMAVTATVHNATNPGEYIYTGPPLKAKVIFKAEPGDDFDQE
jgi:hypothetical protein